MGFEKLIIGQITGAAKNAFKMDIAVDEIKSTLIKTSSDQIEGKIPILLPFNTQDVLNNPSTLPPNLISTETISKVSPIPENEKQSIRRVLDTIEGNLKRTIGVKNDLSGALNTLVKPIDTLEKLSETLSKVIPPLKTVITTLKFLPAPVSIPPGIGIPVSVINGFTLILDSMKTIIDKTEGPISIVSSSIDQIQKVIRPLIGKLSIMDPIFTTLTQIIIFIRVLLDFGPKATIDQINEVSTKTTTDVLSLLLDSPGPLMSNSNSEINAASEVILLNRLEPNSNTPLIYRGFKLIIQYDPTNKFSIPSRRIKGTFIDGTSGISNTGVDIDLTSRLKGTTIYNLPLVPVTDLNDIRITESNSGHPYSFSSSTQVLLSEIYYEIDQLISGKESLILKEAKAIIEDAINDIKQPKNKPRLPFRKIKNKK